MERASETCERRSGRSGRSEFRYAISETSEEKDMAAEGVYRFRELVRGKRNKDTVCERERRAADVAGPSN